VQLIFDVRIGGNAIHLFGEEEEIMDLLPACFLETEAFAHPQFGDQLQILQPRFFGNFSVGRFFEGFSRFEAAFGQNVGGCGSLPLCPFPDDRDVKFAVFSAHDDTTGGGFFQNLGRTLIPTVINGNCSHCKSFYT